MSDYRRWFVAGGTYFFTLVTCHRYPFFRDSMAREFLGMAIRRTKSSQPFELPAIVLLHDHLHCLVTLPHGDSDYPGRMKAIKDCFTSDWLTAGGHEEPVTASQKRRGHRGIWQRRYHEHVIRDKSDLERHFDYIHFNPVKHGYVTRVKDWPWSSFHRHVTSRHYSENWGSGPLPQLDGMELE
ncbi:MAG: transposase [Planctomycetota bacterium]|nr:MAG: transposase [Planctomycetota bacterium]